MCLILAILIIYTKYFLVTAQNMTFGAVRVITKTPPLAVFFDTLTEEQLARGAGRGDIFL
jgi:hypothetical protein